VNAPAALHRGMDRATLDAAYNNRAAVPGFAALSEERRARSEALRRRLRFEADLRYGDRPRQRLDFFHAGSGAPVFAFIHGGYWQSNDKEPSTFLVEGPLARGFSVALIEYTLAPEAALDAIVAEIRAALDWLAASGRASRLFVGGHSAGGHLAAMMLGHRAVAGVLAISGLFDLEPIRLCYLNEKLGLSEAAARRNSPRLHIPKQAPALTIGVGAAELPELVRQSADYARALRAADIDARYLPLSGHDHFTVLDELARPQGMLCEALCAMGDAA
jgi:arylformamidase